MRCHLKQHRLTVLRVVLTLLSVAAVSFIFYNSFQSADESTVRSTGLREAINSILRTLGIGWELTEHVIRKMAHFAEFFVLGALLSATALAYVPRPKILPTSLGVGIAVAVTDELIQSGSEGRSTQVSDMLLDVSAVLTAVLIAAGIRYLCHRRKGADANGREEDSDE